MSTICAVKFDDRENDVFFPGDVLLCSVVLKTTKPKCLKEISAMVIGKSKVRWNQSSGKHSTRYSNELIYFASKTILQNDPQADSMNLMPGIHSYNFEMQLPSVLPSSYQGQYGETHYEVKITLARGWKFDNEFVKPFTVIFPVDLNMNIEFQSPTSEIEQKTSFLNCFSMQPIKVNVKTPHSGYISGQSIPVTVDVSNSSRLNCRKIVVKLHRHTQFLATTPRVNTKYVRTKLIKYELPGVQSSTNKSFTRLLPVPPTPPTSPQIIDIIRIWYTITVEAVMGLFHHNLKMYVPMTIGTIPLIESTQDDARSSSFDDAPFLTHMSSFEETRPENKCFVDEDRDKFIKYGPFAPKYPVFNN